MVITEGDMNEGVGQGLRIAAAAVLAIVLLIGLPLAWVVIGSWVGRHRAESEMTSLCEAVPVGADTSTMLRLAAERGVALSHEPGGATYTHRRLMAGYNEISCEFRVDAAGTVVARTFHPPGPISLRRAAGAARGASAARATGAASVSSAAASR